MKTKPEALCLSDIGTRENQEDNFVLGQSCFNSDLVAWQNQSRQSFQKSIPILSKGCYAVCDGLGGHQGGEKASLLCANALIELQKSLPSCHCLEEMVQRGQKMVARLNERVVEIGKRVESLRGMGAALVILLVCENEYALLNIGDCRGYHFDGKTLRQLSKDQTEGARMIDLGLLKMEELNSFQAKDDLYNYIGKDSPGLILQAEVVYPKSSQGLFVLCSDGIYKSLSSESIEKILCQEPDLELAGRKILKQAVKKENADNATLMLIPIRR